jgi:hypothetical protein
MNARADAYERLDGRYETRVLEPSPPAVTDDPWLADDPAARGDVPAGRSVVSPVGTGDLRWDDLRERPRALGLVRGSLARRLPPPGPGPT